MPLFFSFLLHPLNDVTTTIDAPPAFIELAKIEANQTRNMNYEPGTGEVQRKLHPKLAPLETQISADDAFRAVVTLAKNQADWLVVSTSAEQRRVEAVATTAVLRFKDDVVIEVRVSDQGFGVVHMRSKSRTGRSDLGTNAGRIEDFMAKLRLQLSRL